MGLSRYLAKLGGLVGSDGRVLAAGLAPDAQFPGFKNRFINSALTVDQRVTASGLIIPNQSWTYGLDRWGCYSHVASKYSVARSTDVPVGELIPYSMLFTSLSAYTPAVGEFCGFKQGIEGFNVADFAWGTAAAQPATLSFWAKSSIAGAFGGSVYNHDASRSYAYGYTISSPNTWEKKFINVPGDTSGTWLKDNGAGILVDWVLGAGGTFNNASSSSWANGWNHLSSNTNLLATNGATLRIAGAQFEPGLTPTRFDLRSHGSELALCHRYYYRMKAATNYANFGIGRAYSTSGAGINIELPVPMRAVPTGGTGNWADFNSSGTSTTVTGIDPVNQYDANFRRITINVTSTFVNGQVVALNANNTTAAEFFWSAEI